MSAVMQIAAPIFRESFAPPTKLTGSQWADTHGWIARGSGASEPGPYRVARTPYMAEILDVLADDRHRDVVINKPAQVGYTEVINQFVQYCIVADPSGMLVVLPSIDSAKAWVKERIDPVLRENPVMHGRIRSEGGRRTSDDTMQRKVFMGGYLVAVGSNSPTGLRSRPVRRLIGDERSGWTFDAKSQGDPWELGTERTVTFWNAKRVQGSTPGDEETCPTTAALKVSDWREYHVECPACGFREPFTWKAPDGTYRIVCERDAANQLVVDSAKYLCTSCGVLIPEAEKARMLVGGQWTPRYPGRDIVGFDLNGLMSLWRTWAEVMKLWLAAQGNPEKLKVFDTHVLGKPSRALSDRIEVHTLTKRMEDCEVLPVQIGALFASVDVQKDRLESLIIGVGENDEVWCLEWLQHDGGPERAATWHEVLEHLMRPRDAALMGVAVDTGFLTDTVWEKTASWSAIGRFPVYGVKGVAGRGRKWVEQPAASRKKLRNRPWTIGTDTAKDALALRFPIAVPPGGAGAIHIADTIDPVFCDQLTAEERKRGIVAGRVQWVWRLKNPQLRNEALDLLIYALGAYYARGPKFKAQLSELAAGRGERRAALLDPVGAAAARPASSGYGMLSRGIDG